MQAASWEACESISDYLLSLTDAWQLGWCIPVGLLQDVDLDSVCMGSDKCHRIDPVLIRYPWGPVMSIRNGKGNTIPASFPNAGTHHPDCKSLSTYGARRD